MLSLDKNHESRSICVALERSPSAFPGMGKSFVQKLEQPTEDPDAVRGL